MKECPYCHSMNADDATRCRKCCAGFPQEKILTESTKEVSVETNNNGASAPRKKRNRGE